jgi:uncharacterized protein DUF1549
MHARGILLLSFLMACGSSSGEEPTTAPPAPEPESHAPRPTNTCLDGEQHDNPIDAALCERVGPTFMERAPEEELCRRLHLDLVGRIPSEEEMEAHCRDRSPEEMARAIMETDAFVAMEVRYWVQERLRLDHLRTHGTVLVDFDRVAGELARGQAYDDFVARALAHPAVACNQTYPSYDDDFGFHYFTEDAADRAIRAFLGRAPLGGELDDFANLLRVWTPASFSLEPPISNSDYLLVGVLDPAACAGLLGSCTSTLFGHEVTVDLAASLSGATLYTELGDEPSASVEAELEKPGRLLAEQPELWDEAADAALRRLLGWWKSTADQPDTDIPEVRAALAGWFRDTPGHDIRDLYATVASSLLYRTSNELDPDVDKDAPVWKVGPLKAMSPEMWLDSAAMAAGVELGACDIHTDEEPEPDLDEPCAGPYFNAYLREPPPAGLWHEPGVGPFDYFEAAHRMGGCLGGKPHQAHPGLMTLFAEVDLAPRICRGAAALGLDGADADTLARTLFRRFFGREPTGHEIEPALAEGACLADGACSVTELAEAYCGALLRSAAFTYY